MTLQNSCALDFAGTVINQTFLALSKSCNYDGLIMILDFAVNFSGVLVYRLVVSLILTLATE